MIRVKTGGLVFIVGPVSTQATVAPYKIGRPYDTWYDITTGVSYVFRRNRWVRQRKLKPIKARRSKRMPYRGG